MSAGKLEVQVHTANVKNVEAVKRMDGWVKMTLGDQIQQTTEKKGTATPEWEETFVFNVADAAAQRLDVQVFLGEDEVGAVNLVLDSLKKGVATYKGVACRGGKMDMTLRALDFGKEAEATEDANEDWMSFM
eukprot:TRINITY_DN569_c0_g1_i1.p3 TRINITY_DN569_c0_g1~~TRINITY_DN569_c0_g1_i1.p3  ORF type:complete len:132 (+),score=36.71 TRINITY_DN569_c0_g1_i1:24-419(+)